MLSILVLLALTLAPGAFYLAIGGWDFEPGSSGGFIFPNSPADVVVGPTGPGGASPITSWTSLATDGLNSQGAYTIQLTDVSTVPEPEV